MSSAILIRAVSRYGAYDEGEIPPVIRPKGMIVFCQATPFTFGSEETLPAFVRLYVNTLFENVEYLQEPWTQNLDWTIISNDPVTDTWRLSMFSLNAGGGAGNIIFSVLEKFLSDWGFTIVSIADNDITVDLQVYDGIVSRGMWGDVGDSILFTEVAYDEPTGIHRVSADYSAITRNIATEIDMMVRERGGNIVTHDNSVIVFDMNKFDVLDKLKVGYQEVGSRQISPRRYMFSETLVDAAIAAGGELTLGPAVVLPEVIDLSA